MNLVQVVSRSHSPLPVVIFKYVITVSKLSWVSLGLFGFKSVGASNGGLVVDMIRVLTLRWLESLVVETWVCGFSSTGWAWEGTMDMI